jgi:hypothetical protein
MAELVDARDLKASGPFEIIASSAQTRPFEHMENDAKRGDLQNIFRDRRGA